MPELPKGVTPKKRDDGRVDLVHTDDAGQPYVALTTEGTDVTEDDVAALASGDRERTNPREFTQRVIEQNAKGWQQYSDGMVDDFMEPALIVAHAGTEHHSRFLGSTRKYRENFPTDWR